MKIIVAGAFSNYCLESSYAKALIANGHDVIQFDMEAEMRKHIRFGKVGSLLHAHLGINAWIKNGNKSFVTKALDFKPDILICAGNTQISFGSLAFLKSNFDLRTVLIWPDPLINLNSEILLSAPMWDYLATFNKATLPVLHKLGFPKVVWLPFAADMSAHYMAFKEGKKQNDVAFVGGWRPEREDALLAIAKNFPELKIKIYGPFWDKCQDKSLRKVATPHPLFGKEFSRVVQDSMINLNVIDAAGYPAANMRFYEIPIAGGFELCSSVPELEDTFRDGEDLFFFKNRKELIEKVDAAIKEPERIEKMGKRMQERIYRDHNYETRSNDLIKLITE